MAHSLRLALVAAGILLAPLPSLAQEDDGKREADACQGDVHRLCDKFFPDDRLVATCLVDRRAELSPACAELLAHPPGKDAKRSKTPDADPAKTPDADSAKTPDADSAKTPDADSAKTPDADPAPAR